MSRTNTSDSAFVSSSATSVAVDWNATNRPSSDMELRDEPPFELLPFCATETLTVAPETRSRRKMSATPLASPSTMSLAALVQLTYRPSPETDGSVDDAFGARPESSVTLTRLISWWFRSLTKTS